MKYLKGLGIRITSAIHVLVMGIRTGEGGLVE